MTLDNKLGLTDSLLNQLSQKSHAKSEHGICQRI